MTETQELAPVRKKTIKDRLKVARAKWAPRYYRVRLALHEHKEGRITAFQFVCFIAGLFFISFWSVPIAGVIGAVVAIIAAERQ